MVAIDELLAAGFALPNDPVLQAQAYFPALAAIAAGGSARLDTLGKSPQSTFFAASKESPRARRQKQAMDRRARVAVHNALVDLLVQMSHGEVGLPSQQIGERYLRDVKPCPGYTYRHRACGRLRNVPWSCDFILCPHCQRRRANKYRRVLGEMIEAGYVVNPKLLTFNPPNFKDLTREAVGSLGKALTQLFRRKSMAEVAGGIRSTEVTHGQNGWNLHAHVLADMEWVAHYPQTDIAYSGTWHVVEKILDPRQEIEWRGGVAVPGQEVWPSWSISRWKVVKRHPGLAREFTAVCQNWPELRSSRPGFDLDNPDHWYFVEIRRADKNSVKEIAKYVTKGSDVILAGGTAVTEFVLAFKSVRSIQPFGSFYGKVDLKLGEVSGPGPSADCGGEDMVEGGMVAKDELALEAMFWDSRGDVVDDVSGPDVPEHPPPEQRVFPGMCPHGDCPDRSSMEYDLVCRGIPDSSLGVEVDWDEETRSYRVLVGLDLE